MTGRIQQPATGARPQVQRAATAAPVKVTPGPAGKPPPKNEFSVSQGRSLVPEGTHVSKSMDAGALWGAAPAPKADPTDDPRKIIAMSPEQRTAKLEQLQARRTELQGEIDQRAGQLDRKWERLPPGTKIRALRHYCDNSERLDNGTRRECRRWVDRAELSQEEIDRLRARRDGMPPARKANVEMRRKRAELNAELRAARKEQKQALKEATKVIDDAGLKLDRLAVTEQIIDPNAPPAGSPDSLLGKLKEIFKLDKLITWVGGLIQIFNDMTVENARFNNQMHEKELEYADHSARIEAERATLARLQAELKSQRNA